MDMELTRHTTVCVLSDARHVITVDHYEVKFIDKTPCSHSDHLGEYDTVLQSRILI